MKILVFGGAGFIGTNVCLEGLSICSSVTAFDSLLRSGVRENLEILKKHQRFQFIRGDIRQVKHFSRLDKTYDCIINLAANPSVPMSLNNPQYDARVNIIGHLNILDWAKTHGKIPVLLASTNKVYTDEINRLPMRETGRRYEFTGKSRRFGFNEETEVGGAAGFTNSPYGVSKLSAEKYSREYWKHFGVPMVVNRMSCIYGLYQKGVEEQGWVDWFLRAKKFGKKITIFGNGKQVRDLLFGTDLAKLFLYEATHIDKVNGQTFNVGGGVADGFHISLLELIERLDQLFPGRKMRYSFRPWRPSDQRIFVSDTRKVTAVTGWKPKTSIDEGLKAMWQFYRKS